MDIYSKIDRSSNSWLSNQQLEMKLKQGLTGFSSGTLPNKTRSKVYNQKICLIMGFTIPKSFKRGIKPKFPILDFDVYIQQSNNLQIWNETIPFDRRYVIIRVDGNGTFITLKVISGDELSEYDSTGTITTKLQAILDTSHIVNLLKNNTDTISLLPYIGVNMDTNKKPSDNPTNGEILSIVEIFNRLSILIGTTFTDTNSDRQRGDYVHKLCCQALGYTTFSDDGQFPDIRNQLLEVKTQTSPTIDIGRENPVDTIKRNTEYSLNIANEDIRYVIVYAEILQNTVVIKNIILTSGKYFFDTFNKMEGNGINKKIQLPLPSGFFN